MQKIKEFGNIRIIIFVIASLCIALYTLVMISGYSGVKKEAQPTRDKGSNGYYIFYTLLKRCGYKIQHWDPFTSFRQDAVLFYFNYTNDQAREFREIKDRVSRGNVLFLIGIKTDTDPVFNNKIIHGDIQEIDVHSSLDDDIDEFSYKSSLYFDKESKGEILLGNSRGSLLLRDDFKQGTVYLLSDSMLFSNRSLVNENNAVFLNNLLKEYYMNSIFVHEPVPVVTTSPVAFLFRGRLFYLTIHLLLMGLVFILINVVRFGNPVMANPLARRTLQEHLNAVGYFYLKSNALHLADTYGVKYFVYQVKNILGIKKRVSIKKLVKIIQKYDSIHETENELLALFSKTGDAPEGTVVKERSLLKKRQKRSEIMKRLKKMRG